MMQNAAEVKNQISITLALLQTCHAVLGIGDSKKKIFALQEKFNKHALYDCTKCFKKVNDTNYQLETSHVCSN